jgi:predicted nucleic acid-binding protein
MVILDTNVVSELMREAPHPVVLRWLRGQKTGHLHLTSLTVAEIRRGLELLPEGRRRKALEKAFATFLHKGFAGRILPFTEKTTPFYAPLYRARVRAGLGVGELDLLIAGISREHGARLATRNTADFHECGLDLINPWLA